MKKGVIISTGAVTSMILLILVMTLQNIEPCNTLKWINYWQSINIITLLLGGYIFVADTLKKSEE